MLMMLIYDSMFMVLCCCVYDVSICLRALPASPPSFVVVSVVCFMSCVLLVVGGPVVAVNADVDKSSCLPSELCQQTTTCTVNTTVTTTTSVTRTTALPTRTYDGHGDLGGEGLKRREGRIGS
jgi:hypothetical protein